MSALAGTSVEVPVRLVNLYDRDLEASFRISAPAGWDAPQAAPFSLKKGQTLTIPAKVSVPENAEPKDVVLTAAFTFKWDLLPTVEKTLTLGVFTRDMLGNLVKNGGLEEGADNPEGWKTDGKKSLWVEPKGDGTGKKCLKLLSDGESDYTHSGPPGIPVRAGQKYLYTAWVWSQSMKGGSNLWETYQDGKTKNITCYQVFGISDSDYWQYKSCFYTAPANIKTVGLVPVVAQIKPGGFALYDNVRFTLFEGSEFAAECHRAKGKVTIDGKLDEGEWVFKCPLPFIGTGQLRKLDPTCTPSPDNLSAVAYLMWDEANLYLAAKVRDDKLTTSTAWGEEVKDGGDGFRLGFDPSFRGERSKDCSFELQIAPSKEARHIIFRPKDRSAGLQSGHLYRDSSVFEFAAKPCEGGIVYELRMPFAALGELKGGTLGGKFGYSMLLTDDDGKGPAAQINWGGGLAPNWTPADFGVVTFVE
jgi:hypothetical protein